MRWQRIEQKAEGIERDFAIFRKTQTGDQPGTQKIRLKENDKYAKIWRNFAPILDHLLAAEYGIDHANITKQEDYNQRFAQWRQTHQPFHWFVEFYRIIQEEGGFDVIIGNPPYVEYSKVRKGLYCPRL